MTVVAGFCVFGLALGCGGASTQGKAASPNEVTGSTGGAVPAAPSNPTSNTGGAPGGGAHAESSPEVERAIDAIKANDFRSARAALERAVAKDPNDGVAHYYLGVSLENLADKQGAEQQYKSAIALAPDLSEASINLGALYLDAGKFDEALNVTRAALSRKPDEPSLHANLALALRAKGDKEAAAAEFQKAIQVIGDNPELRMGYAEVLLGLGRKEQAAGELRRALSSAGTNRPLLASIGRLLGPAGAYADCVAAFDRAISAGDDPEFRVRRGLCRHSLQDEPGAKADFEAAIKLNGKYAPAHYYLGEALLAAGDRSRAVREFDAAAAAAPSSEIGKKAKERAQAARHATKKKK